MVMGIMVAAPQAVYNKTPRGREALNDRQAGLQIKHRRVLILLDGTRSISAVAAMLAGMELNSIIHDLHEHGMIEPIAKSSMAVAPTPPALQQPTRTPTPTAMPAPMLKPAAKTADAGELDPLLLTKAKLVMQESARKYLGLMAQKLLHEIAAAQTHEQMRTALAHWNMAIRESPKGNAEAGLLMVEVRAILNWKPA